MDISKKVFGSNVSKEIRDYFNDIQDGSVIEPGQPIPTKQPNYLGDKTPFARMWTIVKKTSFEVKEVDGKKKLSPLPKPEIITHIVNSNQVESYSELSSIGELTENKYLKPPAGITEVSSDSTGALGAMRQTTIRFTVHNKKDLDEIFLPFFLKPGSQVFVDFGWSDKNLNLYDVDDLTKNRDDELTGLYEDIYKENDDSIFSKGLMTTLNGQVKRYDVKVNANQSFECSLEVISTNYHLVDKSITPDNNLKFVFTNILEDLLLLRYASTFEGKEAEQFVKNQLFNINSWSKISPAEREAANKNFFDNNRDFNPKSDLIPSYYRQVGIFYQDLSNQRKQLDQKESLYMSWALFEDEFLNRFVAFQEVDGVETGPDKNIKLPKFNSVNCYVRWDENLFKMMKIKPELSDNNLSFLYPDTWDDEETSNKYKPTALTEQGEKDWKDTDDDKEKRRIPIRELFINTTTIIEAFKSADDIGKALEKIFDTIHEHSGELINIRFIKNNDAETSMGFHDSNSQPVKSIDPSDVLKFNVTSGNGVVLDANLAFETPKSALSSMIAIGQSSTPQLYDEFELMKFNLLNELQTNQTTTNRFVYKNLPALGEKPKISTNLSTDYSTMFGKNNVITNAPDEINPFLEKDRESLVNFLGIINIEKGFSTIKNYRFQDFKKKQEELYEQSSSLEIKKPTDYTIEKEDERGRIKFTANSERDLELMYAKIINMSSRETNSVAVVMPISLTLDVYGNNFLNIGDYFTVNFLPKQFQDNVYFQVVGVNHNLSTSNWKTTYNTVMRTYTKRKYQQFSFDPNGPLTNQFIVTLGGELKKALYKNIDESGGTPVFGSSYAKHLLKMTMDGFPRIAKTGDLSPPPGVEGISSIPYKVLDVKYDHLALTEDDIKNAKLKDLNLLVPNKNNNDASYSQGQLAWHIAVSELLLGEDVIDWKKYKKETNKTDFFFKAVTQSTIIDDLKPSKGKIAIITTKENGEVGNLYNLKIVKKIDRYKFNIIGLDDSAKAIIKYIDSLAGKQSQDITAPTDTRYASQDEYSGFYFLYTLTWELENTSAVNGNEIINKFFIFDFTSDEKKYDSQVYPIIQIPREYFKISYDEFLTKLYNRYSIHKNKIMRLIEEPFYEEIDKRKAFIEGNR